MGDRMDEAKGRVKEAAGDLTNDDELKREGKLDRAGAKVKRKADEVVDGAKEKVNETLDDES
ncbi:MAG TPA: CsbD family protein [Actinomycetota bacterium]